MRKDLAHSGSLAHPSLLSLRTAMRHPDQAPQDAALVLEAAQGVLSGAPSRSTTCCVFCQGRVAWQLAGPLSPQARKQHQINRSARKLTWWPTSQACSQAEQNNLSSPPAQVKVLLCACAGSASQLQQLMLGLCLEALAATGVLAPDAMQGLQRAAADLDLLRHLQQRLAQVINASCACEEQLDRDECCQITCSCWPVPSMAFYLLPGHSLLAEMLNTSGAGH